MIRQLFATFLLITVCTLLCTSCDAAANGDKTRKVQACAKKCDHCFMESDSLGRLECVETCKEGDSDAFTCSLGGNAKPEPEPSPKNQQLRKELNEIYKKRAEYLKARDFEGIKSLYTEDASFYIDTIPPGFGRKAIGETNDDWLAANPRLAYGTYTSNGNYGEDETAGKVWDNGDVQTFDSEDNYVATYRFITIFKRIDDKLYQYMDILFTANQMCANSAFDQVGRR